MSFTNLKSEMHKARKIYPCDACEWIEIEDLRQNIKLTKSEWRAILTARNNHWKISKGQKYIYQVNIIDGDFCIFRCIPEIHTICLKYKIYPED